MEAQRAFEDALCAEGTVPWERARAAYNLGIVHHEQGNVAEAERCFGVLVAMAACGRHITSVRST